LQYLEDFAQAGADSITLHVECGSPVDETIAAIRALRTKSGEAVKAGLSLKPATPVEAVYPYLNELDMVLVMTVEPGFGGQAFIPEMLPKIAALRQKSAQDSKPPIIQVDGGINQKNARAVISAGADCLVAGSAVFGAKDVSAVITEIRLSRNGLDK
jgi:ribulose-phosphate 3-epimerase